MCCFVKMSDNDARDPAEAFTDVGEMKPQKEVFSGEGDPEPAEVAPPPCPTSHDSDDDAGGEKRAVANSIFQACTAYRQNFMNQLQDDAVSYKMTALVVGAAFGFLVLCVAVIVIVTRNLWDSSEQNDDNDTSNKTAVNDNNSGLFTLVYPYPEESVGKVYDLYGSVGAFAEDLYLHEEASPQDPKNASGLEDSYLNVLDAI